VAAFTCSGGAPYAQWGERTRGEIRSGRKSSHVINRGGELPKSEVLSIEGQALGAARTTEQKSSTRRRLYTLPHRAIAAKISDLNHRHPKLPLGIRHSQESEKIRKVNPKLTVNRGNWSGKNVRRWVVRGGFGRGEGCEEMLNAMWAGSRADQGEGKKDSRRRRGSRLREGGGESGSDVDF